jgi:hypothetical protein
MISNPKSFKLSTKYRQAITNSKLQVQDFHYDAREENLQLWPYNA